MKGIQRRNPPRAQPSKVKVQLTHSNSTKIFQIEREKVSTLRLTSEEKFLRIRGELQKLYKDYILVLSEKKIEKLEEFEKRINDILCQAVEFASE